MGNSLIPMLDIQRPLWRFEAEGLADNTIIGFSSFSVGDLIQKMKNYHEFVKKNILKRQSPQKNEFYKSAKSKYKGNKR